MVDVLLKCPYCTTELHEHYSVCSGLRIFQCSCRKYPVIADIIFLKKIPLPVLGKVLASIKQGSTLTALWNIMYEESKRTRIVMIFLYFLRRAGVVISDLILFKLLSTLLPSFLNWFAYGTRFEKRKISQFPILNFKKVKYASKKIVDVGSGAAHLFTTLAKNGIQIGKECICLDNSFLALLTARLRKTDLGCTYICTDVNYYLPFFDEDIHTIIAIDSFPWIKNKKRFIQECNRTLMRLGEIHLINIHFTNYPTPISSFGCTSHQLTQYLRPFFSYILFDSNYNKISRLHTAQGDYSCIAQKK